MASRRNGVVGTTMVVAIRPGRKREKELKKVGSGEENDR